MQLGRDQFLSVELGAEKMSIKPDSHKIVLTDCIMSRSLNCQLMFVSSTVNCITFAEMCDIFVNKGIYSQHASILLQDPQTWCS